MEIRPGQRSGPLTGRQVAHYRISDVIGAGGMGEVYLASDERLRRTVAIKALPERLAGDEQARRRFIRETRVASRVTHPYVATVFDVIESDGSLLLVMEHIEGQTLSALLRQGELERETVTRYALEISEALQAIHRKGLVHRDLKPGNVMITPDGHVKVMDFGLARPLVIERDQPTETAITGEGRGVGTPLYMSPEQLRGEEVGPGSDLFSLGVVLYETASGEHPFRRESAVESTAAILFESPGGGSEPESLSNSGPLRDVVMRLLEKEVANRYESCDALVEDLRSISRSSLHPWGSRKLRRRRRVVATTLIVVVLASLAAAMAWVRQPPSWDRPRYAVAVVPFRDQTRMNDGDVKSAMLSDLLAADLESSHLVRAIGPERTSSLVASLPVGAAADKVARRVLAGASVDYVLLGTLYHENGLYVATLAFEPAVGDLPRPSTLREENSDLLALVDSLGASLRGGLPDVSRVNAWRDDRAGVEDISAESDEARLHFERGMLAGRDGKLTEAIDHFEAAVTAEPAFALGHARLAQALLAAGYGRRSREAAEKAIRLDPGRDTRAGRRLSLMIQATRARVFNRTEEAVEITGELAALFPDEPSMLAKHAGALTTAVEYESALNLFDRAIDADSLNAGLHVARAETLRLAGRFDDAFLTLDKAKGLYEVVSSVEGLVNVAYLRGHVYFSKKQFDAARAEYEKSEALLPPDGLELLASRILFQGGQLDIMQGRSESARERIHAGEALARSVGDLGSLCNALTAQGALYHTSGYYQAAEESYRSSIDLARQLENDLLLLSAVGNLAGLMTAQGHLVEAQELFVESSELASKLGNISKAVLAEIYLSDVLRQQGKVDEAVESYETVLERRSQAGLEYLTTWAYLGLAEIHERRGRLEEALGACDRGIEASREGGLTNIEGYGLARRGQVLGLLLRTEEAFDDIEAAEAIATHPGAGLHELQVRASLARATALGYSGRWRQAIEIAEKLPDLPGGSAPDLAGSALELVCLGHVETGRPELAVAACRRALEWTGLPRVEQAGARALLSEALASTGEFESARDEALGALRDAAEMDLLVPLTRASVVLLGLPPRMRPERIKEVRKQGRATLERIVAAAPEPDRENVRGRFDLVRWGTELADQ